MTDTITGFGVIIKRKDGSQFFATHNEDGCAFFWKRKAAVEFKRELNENKITSSVVKVQVTYETI